jgi:hypothetical protein
MRGSFFGVGAIFLAVACGSGKSPSQPCDPTLDDSCNLTPGQNPCHSNADCGDGKCLPDGTCQAPATAGQSSACAGVSCKSTEFCSNGLCLPSGPVCKPADSTCIFVPSRRRTSGGGRSGPPPGRRSIRSSTRTTWTTAPT